MSSPTDPSSTPAAGPCLLALDCATETVHLGLCAGERQWTLRLPGGAAASAALLPAIESLMARAGKPLQALDALAFGRGPGAFTGLRTACAVVQGLALGLDRPVIAIDTLAAVAEDARLAGAPSGTVWAVQDARMGELYVAALRFPDGKDGWTMATPPRLARPEDMPALLAACPGVPAGNGVPLLAAAGVPTGTPDAWPGAEPGGAALLSLARAAWAEGRLQDAALALPLYVRDKVAQTTAERAAAGGAR
jgi:tRNA threonylcarbamoyladenosine biosynthesis protein TsaB